VEPRDTIIAIGSTTMSPQSSPTPSANARPDPRTSWTLLVRAARRGDADALGLLLGRVLPGIERWARGRLPRWVRRGADTPDLIQDAVLGTIRQLDTLELRGRGALAAYLRQAVRNRIRDEYRRVAVRGATIALSRGLADPGASPFDEAAAAADAARYRQALATLTPEDQELVVGHVELGYTHAQLGCMTGRSANAARMALGRAIHRLAQRMGDG
jgi:RNA polymerase sigma-70 factor (ECF subfamily)